MAMINEDTFNIVKALINAKKAASSRKLHNSEKSVKGRVLAGTSIERWVGIFIAISTILFF